VIRLLAFVPEDGWAYVRSGAQIRLLRPPYRKRRHRVVPESAVRRAVAEEGFRAEQRDFPDWPALFLFLEQRFLAGFSPPPATLAPDAAVRVLLQRWKYWLDWS
jgi:hypothetical protein